VISSPSSPDYHENLCNDIITMGQDLKPLLLHAHAEGPNPIKISIVLEFLQLQYNLQLWEAGDDPKKGVKGTAFLKVNENGRVPALEDPNTGVVAWESGAIVNYILRVYDQNNKVGPRGNTEQDRVDFDKWTYFLVTTLAPMSGQCNWFR
jgi:glutathione S-transferase